MRVFSTGIVCLFAAVLTTPLLAQFAPGPNPISTTVGAQTLSSGTGTINGTGAISITTNGVALTINGTSTLVNNGTIQTTGTGRAIDSNSGILILNLTNTGLISAASSDAFRLNTNSEVTLVNSGTIRVTNGGQAIDWAAITSKPNSLTNQSTGFITAVGEDAVRPGTNGVVINAGTISATPTGGASPTGSDGVDLRTFTGISVTNTGTITGRHGIATDGANVSGATSVANNTGGKITAINGSGINIDGANTNVTANVINQVGATIQGGVLAVATEADGDGIDVDGVLTLNNSGDVLGLGAKGGTNNAEGVAAGGGSITNNASGKIIGSTLLADAPNGDSSRAGNGILIDNSNGGNAIAATSVNNSGLIQGKSGFAVKMIGNFADTVINNTGGILRGAGTGAAVQTGGGADSVTNAGSILSDILNAIDLGDGDDILKIEGGAAEITGDIFGGAGIDRFLVDAGAGNSFVFGNSMSGIEVVEVRSGTFKVNGANRISSSAALELNGGTFEIAGAGAGGQTFACLLLSNNSAINLSFTSSLTFNCLGAVASGVTLAVTGYSEGVSDYAFRFLGDLSANAGFLSLIGQTTVNGYLAGYRFDGAFTDVFATPEPSTFALLGLGVAVFAMRRARTRGGRKLTSLSQAERQAAGPQGPARQ